MTLSNGVGKSPLLDLPDAAAQLKISQRTLRRWRRRGKLRTYKVAGRLHVLQLDIDALLTPQEQK